MALKGRDNTNQWVRRRKEKTCGRGGWGTTVEEKGSLGGQVGEHEIIAKFGVKHKRNWEKKG